VVPFVGRFAAEKLRSGERRVMSKEAGRQNLAGAEESRFLASLGMTSFMLVSILYVNMAELIRQQIV